MIKITAETTDEQINDIVDSARKALVEAAGSDQFDSERLSKIVNSIAEAEGKARAAWRYRAGLRTQGTHEAAFLFVLKEMTNGAGDTWSGRGNDTLRARFDGYCRAAADLEFN